MDDPSSRICGLDFNHNHDDKSTSFTKKKMTRSKSYDSVQPARKSRHGFRIHRLDPHQTTSQSHIVCAISENLARETCIVSLDVACPVILNVTKQYNGQNYAETISCISVLSPNEILMNEGRVNSPLARKVVQHCKHLQGAEETTREEDDTLASSTVVKFVSRAFFDQTKGADLLHKLARKDAYDCKALNQEYILLSSTHAILHYTQRCLGLSFMNNCLDVRSFFSEGSDSNPRIMDIDRSTIMQLELLTSSTGKSRGSFFSAIDCTRTTVGNRLLRSTIMAPPCRLPTIHARLELVETFLSNEQLFYSILKQLQTLHPIDKMLSDIALVPDNHSKMTADGESVGESLDSASYMFQRNHRNSILRRNATNARLAQKGIAALVGIKSTISFIPFIASTLKNHFKTTIAKEDNYQEDCEESRATNVSNLLMGLGVPDHQRNSSFSKISSSTSTKASQHQKHILLRAIISAMTQPELEEIGQVIDEALRGNASYARNGNAARHQECFALKSSSEAFGAMDIIRKAFLKNVDDIYKKADEYAEVHGIYVSVKYGRAKGYYLSLPSSSARDLPEVFIQPTKAGNGTYIHCTTEEVQSLNIRVQDNIQDLLTHTHERIQQVLDVARSYYDSLARVSDAIALLDLCHGFADKVTLSKESWVPPVILEPHSSIVAKESICIRDGRCVVDDLILGALGNGIAQMITNDVCCSPLQIFTVVSGVNGSGKVGWDWIRLLQSQWRASS
jgi:DNA mismatch repair protein MSH4